MVINLANATGRHIPSVDSENSTSNPSYHRNGAMYDTKIGDLNDFEGRNGRFFTDFGRFGSQLRQSY